MSERLMFGSIEDAPRNVEIVQDVGQKALSLMVQRYGTGFPNFCAGEQWLGNHNGHHARAVGDGSARLNEALGFEKLDVELGRMTGYSHDLVQGKGRGTDERESAEWAEAELRERGLPTVKAKLSALAILGTLPTFDQDGLSGQTVNDMEFDSRFIEQFAKSVASADLGTLFTPVGPLDAHKLYGEIQGVSALEAPNMDDMAEFLRKQVVLVNRYEYPLGALAEKVLASHKLQVVRYVEHVYAQVLRGDIETWDQLMAQDMAFYHNPDMRLGAMRRLAEVEYA